MPSQTLKQLRLEHAWKCAESAQEALVAQYGEYTNAAKNLSTQIRSNGLGQALAYLAAEGRSKNGSLNKPKGYLYRHVESWLTDRSELEADDAPKGSYAEPPPGENSGASTRLIYRIARSNSRRARWGISEAVDYLDVLRDAAGAVAVGPFETAGDDDDDGKTVDEETAATPSEEPPAAT